MSEGTHALDYDAIIAALDLFERRLAELERRVDPIPTSMPPPAPAPTKPFPFVQQDGDLYNSDGVMVAWFDCASKKRVWVDTDVTSDELRAIADWMETQNAG